jgi:hypothetical protein
VVVIIFVEGSTKVSTSKVEGTMSFVPEVDGEVVVVVVNLSSTNPPDGLSEYAPLVSPVGGIITGATIPDGVGIFVGITAPAPEGALGLLAVGRLDIPES